LAWMRKSRVKALNRIIAIIKEKTNEKGKENEKAEVDETEVLRMIMREEWISKTTAQRYIDDLVFMGRISRNNHHLKISEAEEK